MLHRRALGAFGRGDEIAQRPESFGLGLTGGEDGILGQSPLEGVSQQRLGPVAQGGGGLGIGSQLDRACQACGWPSGARASGR